MDNAKLFVPRCTLKCSLQPYDSQKGSMLRMRRPKTLFSFFHNKLFHVICIFSSFQPAGHQEAIAVCLHIQTQQTVNDSLCDMVHRPPAMSQACNTEPCPPRYVLSCVPGIYHVRVVTPSLQRNPPKCRLVASPKVDVLSLLQSSLLC